jgi:serine/threonine protein kinase
MTPEPVESDNRTEGDFNVSQVWLDALARGACDEEAFLRAVQMLTRRSPEAAWDSLALLDQYYRRGKIKPDVFKRVKSRLGSQLLGPALDVELSVPLRRKVAPSAPAAVVIPVPSSAGSAATPPVAPAAAAPPLDSVPSHQSPPRSAAVKPVAAPLAPMAAPLAPVAAPLAPARASVPPPAPRPPATDSASPPVFLASPSPRVAANPQTAGASSTGRTVPIGIDSASIPTPNPVGRPADDTNPSRARAREVTVGDVLRGRYVINNVLGLGGTATVFEAIDRYRLDLADSGQRIAVKVLHSGASEQTAVLTDLRREFQLLQSLSHPNIVRAHEYDRDGDTAFFTMEYLSGLSLESVLSAHGDVVLGRTNALVIIRDVAAALEHAHSRGVVHGDLNPGNIFITNDGEIRVLDFGAAHTPSESPPLTESAWESTAFATPRYASCQLLDGERADVRDDTYSLACVLYVLLAGKQPFGDLNAAQARAQRLKPRRPAGLTGAQWGSLRSGLSFDRQRRSADIAGWLEPFDLPKAEVRLPVLLALLKTPPRRSRRGGAAGVLIVVLLALAAAGWWASGHMDLVLQTARDAGGSLNDTLASAEASLTQWWHQGRNALSSSSDENSPAVSAPEPAAPPTAPIIPPPAAGSPTATPVVRSTQPPRIAPSPALASRPATVPAGAAAAVQPAVVAAQPAHARIELAADSVDVPLSSPAAHVIVRRSGNLRADAGFTWWTESGTAKPGQDFMSVKPHEEHFEDGKAAVNLLVPVVEDPTRREPKSFYIVINDPSGDASLGKRTLTMVTIPPSQ